MKKEEAKVQKKVLQQDKKKQVIQLKRPVKRKCFGSDDDEDTLLKELVEERISKNRKKSVWSSGSDDSESDSRPAQVMEEPLTTFQDSKIVIY